MRGEGGRERYRSGYYSDHDTHTVSHNNPPVPRCTFTPAPSASRPPPAPPNARSPAPIMRIALRFGSLLHLHGVHVASGGGDGLLRHLCAVPVLEDGKRAGKEGLEGEAGTCDGGEDEPAVETFTAAG